GLRCLARADELVVGRAARRRVHYRVERLGVVDKHAAVAFAPGGGDALVLVTCWPFDALVPGGPLRFVVEARRVPAAAGARSKPARGAGDERAGRAELATLGGAR